MKITTVREFIQQLQAACQDNLEREVKIKHSFPTETFDFIGIDADGPNDIVIHID